MNIVLSGALDPALVERVARLSAAPTIVELHARAVRLEGAKVDEHGKAEIIALCDTARVDHAFLESIKSLSDYRLLAIDMDSTLITIECIDELAAMVGRGAEVAAITEATMRGEIESFEESLRRRVTLLKGADQKILELVYENKLKLSEGARSLIAACNSHGLQT